MINASICLDAVSPKFADGFTRTSWWLQRRGGLKSSHPVERGRKRQGETIGSGAGRRAAACPARCYDASRGCWEAGTGCQNGRQRATYPVELIRSFHANQARETESAFASRAMSDPELLRSTSGSGNGATHEIERDTLRFAVRESLQLLNGDHPPQANRTATILRPVAASAYVIFNGMNASMSRPAGGDCNPL